MSIKRRYRKPRIVSQRDRSWLWLRVLLLLSILGLVGWYGYQMGSTGLQDGLPVFNPSLREKVKQLEAEREELHRQLTIAKQSAEMDQEAIRAIKEQVKRFQDERLKMEEELAFLQGIVSTGSERNGLKIQKFKLSHGGEEGDFQYEFTVNQAINSGLVAKGKIQVSLEGLRKGKTATLELAEVTEDKLGSHKMRFRYFQNVEGKLKIPKDFKPAKLIIEIKPESKKFDPIKQTFDWAPVA